MPSEWRALRSGESVRERRRQLERAHERFIADAGIAADPELLERFARQAELRPVVFASWLRSQQRTVDPGRAPERPALDADELAELRRIHPIARVMPVVQRLLFEEASDSGLIVAVGDAAGRLLWLDGDARLRSAAEDMGFRAGMDWSEAAVGTSAPGSALALDHAIQVLGAEHYNRAVHQWSCTAAPVHDPTTGAIIGVIDVTGGDSAASPHILPLVEATLAAVEAELKVESLRSLMESGRPGSVPTARSAAVAPRLMVLGRDPALLETGQGSLALTGRHAEILLAVARRPGLGAAALAEEVYGDAASQQTLRAEVVRLRKGLARHGAGIDLLSRPYRLDAPLRIDAVEALEALGRGAHRLALAAYEGPVLPGSAAPAVERLRADVDATLREAMLQSAAPDHLFEYAQHWAGDDAEVWETLLQVLPPHSPKRARVVARLEALQR
ncbi:transcriptional regulator [Leucobacter ruminantium]|uniref:Transcriptional regulator n=1 Tax=Leucobacter ruminantium TaxID=1289170 RepID=A0A939LU06_9MICO|nr:transcriptional regulator [Leucobacter ruminantium]MBO1804341.1 transcriptional regulator [Leucobacter ruminantium]